MSVELFKISHGVIPACDVANLNILEKIVNDTHDLPGIAGYKIGFILALKYGLPVVTRIISKYTDLPIIYDHQKAGTDIPQMGKLFSEICKESGIRGVIIFPQAGPATENEFIDRLLELNLIPIVGGEMTHPKYLSKDGGYLTDDAPLRIYKLAAEKGVNHFVVPGNKPERMRFYHEILSRAIPNAKYILPGIGRQGGDIGSAFESLGESASYAIVGTGIYNNQDIRNSAEIFCKEAIKYVGD